MYAFHCSKSLLCVIILFCIAPIYADEEITGRLEHANDLSRDEINALRPLFNELQKLYDQIANEVSTQSGIIVDDNVTIATTLLHEFEQHFVGLLQRQHEGNDNTNSNSNNKPMTSYDTSLPSVADLMGQPSSDLSAEQLAEREDIEAIFADVRDEAQAQIDELVRQALLLEAQLIKINKPKIVKAVLDVLRVLFQIAVRVSRAAYCTYSHIPQLNQSLHSIYDGVDCYRYATGLVLRIQHETVHTVSTIKKDVFNLADIYKKVAAKHSLLGKLSAMFLNVRKIQRNMKEAVTTGLQSLNLLKNDLPAAAKEAMTCGLTFADDLTTMIATVTNVTTCILYVDDTSTDYDFMHPDDF